MITKSTQKNKYGGYTWEFKLDSLHHIFINETDNGSFVVDFKEWKLFTYKTHFSFVSNNNFKTTISDTLNRIHEYLLSNTKYNFSNQQKEQKLIELLEYISYYNLDEN